jgi:hypothetical protein
MRSRARDVLIVTVAVALFTLVARPASGFARDTVPPSFAGLASATTCIPGPATTPPGSSSYHLSWQSAVDDRTPSRRIVYDIYQADKAGGEDFSHPTYTTAPGATTFDTPKLPDTGWWFVVRARDRADNSDANQVERQGVNLCV